MEKINEINSEIERLAEQLERKRMEAIKQKLEYLSRNQDIEEAHLTEEEWLILESYLEKYGDAASVKMQYSFHRDNINGHDTDVQKTVLRIGNKFISVLRGLDYGYNTYEFEVRDTLETEVNQEDGSVTLNGITFEPEKVERFDIIRNEVFGKEELVEGLDIESLFDPPRENDEEQYTTIPLVEDVIYHAIRGEVVDEQANEMWGERNNFCEIGRYTDRLEDEAGLVNSLNSMSRETLKKYFENNPEDLALFEQTREKYAGILSLDGELEQTADQMSQESKKAVEEYTGYSFEDFIADTKNSFKRPIIVMSDGVSMTVQASEFHYCEPRKNGLETYISYEVEYPSEVIEQLKKYVESPVQSDEELLNSVYHFVPADILRQIVMEHGGIDKESTLNPEKKLEGYRQEKAGMEDKNKKAQDIVNQLAIHIQTEKNDNEKGEK